MNLIKTLKSRCNCVWTPIRISTTAKKGLLGVTAFSVLMIIKYEFKKKAEQARILLKKERLSMVL